MAEQVKPAVAYFEQLRRERATSKSRAGLLPEARQINITPRRLLTNTFEEIVILFKLEGANADIMPSGRLLYLDGVQRTNLPQAFGERSHGNHPGPSPGPPCGGVGWGDQ